MCYFPAAYLEVFIRLRPQQFANTKLLFIFYFLKNTWDFLQLCLVLCNIHKMSLGFYWIIFSLSLEADNSQCRNSLLFWRLSKLTGTALTLTLKCWHWRVTEFSQKTGSYQPLHTFFLSAYAGNNVLERVHLYKSVLCLAYCQSCAVN